MINNNNNTNNNSNIGLIPVVTYSNADTNKSIIYEEVGHAPPWENIKEFNKDLVKFVGGI